MNVRLILGTTMIAVLGCGGADASPTATDEELPQEMREALHDDSGDGGATCRGRYYPIFKDKRSPQIPKGDVELIDTLVPHHRAAVEMADMELERGSDAEVKEMAAKMKADQSAEIEQLLKIRAELTGCTNVTKFPDPHMERDMDMMMSMSGAELDLMFVEDMIPHHAGALVFTHNALPNLKNGELDTLAHEIIDAQSMEIGHLHEIKMRLEGSVTDGGMH